MESISEQVADLEHALRLEREASEQLREELRRSRGVTFHEVPADLLHEAASVRLLELPERPDTPDPIEPCDDWERRRAAWHPGGYPNPEHPFPDDDLPRKRSALREIILEQRVQLEELRERCDAYMNELEGWRSEAKREAHDGDVDQAVADSHLEHAKRLDRELRDARLEADALVENLAVARAHRAELEAERGEIAELLGGLYGNLELPEAVREMLASSRGIRDRRIEELEQALEQALERLAGHRETIVELEKRDEIRLEVIDALHTQIDALGAAVNDPELEAERDALQRDLDRYGPLLAAANERIERLEAELREWRSGGLTVEGLPIDPTQELVDVQELANLRLDRDGWRSRAQALQARVDEIELEIAAGLEATELRRERDEAQARVTELEERLSMTQQNRNAAHERLNNVRGVINRNERTRADDQDGMRLMYREIVEALDAPRPSTWELP